MPIRRELRRLTLSSTKRAAISRTLRFTGTSPTRSVSSLSRMSLTPSLNMNSSTVPTFANKREGHVMNFPRGCRSISSRRDFQVFHHGLSYTCIRRSIYNFTVATFMWMTLFRRLGGRLTCLPSSMSVMYLILANLSSLRISAALSLWSASSALMRASTSAACCERIRTQLDEFARQIGASSSGTWGLRRIT